MIRQVLHWLQSNLVTLVLALFLAVTVWIVATQAENPVDEVNFSPPIPIDVVGLGDNLIITNDYPRQTSVRLRAQQDTMQTITADDITVMADLTGLDPGTYQVPLVVKIADQVQAIFVSARPPHIRVDIEEYRERELPVHLEINGQPAIGFRTDTPQIEPESVQVHGPRSRVDLVSEVVVQVPLDQRRSTFEDALSLAALDSEGDAVEGVTIVPDSVRVIVPLVQEAGYKEVAVVARTVGQPAPGYFVTSIFASPPSVTVRGDPELIASMTGYVETTPVDISGLRDDVIQSDVSLALPPGISLVEQSAIEVLVTIAAQEGTRSERITVEAQGLAEGLQVTFSPAQVDLIISGPLPVLDTLGEGDIRVLVDLTEFVPGVYQVEPNVVILRDDIELESILPLVIEVEITEVEPAEPEGD